MAERVDASQHNSLELLASKYALQRCRRKDQQELPHLQLQLVPATQEHFFLNNQTHADLKGRMDNIAEEVKMILAESNTRERLFEDVDEEEAWHCAIIVNLERAIVLQVKIVGTAFGIEING